MGSQVMNYIDELVIPENRNRSLENNLNELEINLYLVDRAKTENSSRSLDELEKLRDSLQNAQETHFTPCLSERTQKSDIERIEKLFSYFTNYPRLGGDLHLFSKDVITHLSELIELSQSFMRD